MFLINLAITLFGGSRAKENGRCETIDYMNTYHTCVGLLLSSKSLNCRNGLPNWLFSKPLFATKFNPTTYYERKILYE